MLGRRSVPFSTSFRYFITIFYLVQRCKAVQQPLQIHPRSQCKQKLFCSEFEKSNFTFKPPLRILSVLFWRAFFYRSWTVGTLRSYNYVQVRFVLKVISASLSSFLNGAFIVLSSYLNVAIIVFDILNGAFVHRALLVPQGQRHDA